MFFSFWLCAKFNKVTVVTGLFIIPSKLQIRQFVEECISGGFETENGCQSFVMAEVYSES